MPIQLKHLHFLFRVPNHSRIGIVFLLLLLCNFVLPVTADSQAPVHISTYADARQRVLAAQQHLQVTTGEQQSAPTEQIRELAIGQKKATPTPTQPPVVAGNWGVSKQIGEHTWTITVGKDDRNATASEIHAALNGYRQKKGVGTLAWDQKLADFAQSRASSFATNGKLDSHAGFRDFIDNQDGFSKLGFYALGENSSYGFTLEGVHLIEWVYAGDKPHDDNQLSSSWSHVGIGVSGTATNLIFGGKKQ
jgi:uncharacterized protein YkwD